LNYLAVSLIFRIAYSSYCLRAVVLGYAAFPPETTGIFWPSAGETGLIEIALSPTGHAGGVRAALAFLVAGRMEIGFKALRYMQQQELLMLKMDGNMRLG
jgi:hypothetical protein